MLHEYLLGAGLEASALERSAILAFEALDALLVKWSGAIGLTGFRTTEERYRRYFVEPLKALPWVPERGVALDIGSGGGSPALPLGVARPWLQWILVETNERKAQFLEEAVRALGLDALRVEHGRHEDLDLGSDFNLITCRGVRLSEQGLQGILASLAVGGRFLWFGGEERLRSAVAGRRKWVRVDPYPLMPEEARSGWLLVLERP